MTLKQSTFSLLLAGAVLAAAAAYAQQNGKPNAKPEAKPVAAKPGKVSVNGVQIPLSRFELLAKQATAQGQSDGPELQANIKENLIKSEIVSQEAIKAGLDKNPEVLNQLDLLKQNLLVRAYVQNFVKSNPIKEDTLKAEYDKVKSEVGDKEYKIQHILVEDEKQAKDIIAQIKKGGDFDKLAKEKSKDAGSKDAGGKLDWTTPASFVKPFSDALLKLKKGEYTQDPVKSPYGFHVIKLEDSRALKAPQYEEVKEKIRQNQQQNQLNKMLADLRAKAKVEEK